MTFTKYSKNVTDTRGIHKIPLEGNTAKAEHHSAVNLALDVLNHQKCVYP